MNSIKQFDLEFALISILDEKTALIQAKPGFEINADKSQQANNLIENEMPAGFAIIIDRKSDYSIVPIDVYRILNEISQLKAVAIVLNGKRNMLPEDVEKSLFKREFAVFQSIVEAHEWVSQTI